MFKLLHRDASTPMTPDSPPAAPAWTPRQLVLAAVVLSAVAVVALAIDLPLARYFHDEGLPRQLQRLVRLAEVFGWGGGIATIILTAAVLDRRSWRVVPLLAAASLGAGLLADGIKLLVARTRPTAADLGGSVQDTFVAWLPVLPGADLGQAYGHKLQAFPSGHAAAAAGLAAGLAALYPRGRWLFVLLAALSCLQRLDAQAHFASDVLAGAAVGCLVAAVCQRSKCLTAGCGARS